MTEEELLDEARAFCDPETGEVIKRIPEELMQKLRAARLARGIPGRPSERTKSYATWFVFLNDEIRDRVLAEWRKVSTARKRRRQKSAATDTSPRLARQDVQRKVASSRGLRGFRQGRKGAD
jgi:hypothetical protein